MSGGRKRGQFVFWVCFILGVLVVVALLALAVKPAYESVSSVVSLLHIDIPSAFLSNLLISLLIAIMSVILLAAIGVGSLISMILILFLGSRIENATDDILNELLNVIDNARKLKINDEINLELESLYSKTQQIQERQHKRIANKIVRWFRRKGKVKK